MLASNIREQISQLVDAEFKQRLHGLPDKVEAEIRRLTAPPRGQGGHVTVEVSNWLGNELRERARNWTQFILQVIDAHSIYSSKSLPDDFRAELQRYVNRDRESVLTMMRQKYPWLLLQIEKITFAANNELEKQCAAASVRLHQAKSGIKRWGPIAAFVAAGVALVASVVKILEYFGITW